MARKRVAVTLEVDTDQPIATLRLAAYWQRLVGSYCEVHQASANQIRPPKQPITTPRQRGKTR